MQYFSKKTFVQFLKELKDPQQKLKPNPTNQK